MLFESLFPQIYEIPNVKILLQLAGNPPSSSNKKLDTMHSHTEVPI
jgi:hypothetical protein